MRHSKPAKRVKLISIGAKGAVVDDLLVDRISSKHKWLDRGLSIGDANVGPPTPVLKFFDFSNTWIEADGLENLHVVGGDGDGHQYVFGTKSQSFYALWHDPTEFEIVAKTSKEFLQWVIRERSDHLQGCPWEVFTTKRVFLKTVWHKDLINPLPVLEHAQELFEWDRKFTSPHGFQIFNAKHEVDLRFKNEHRGKNSHIQILARKSTAKIESLLKRLKKQGFGTRY